MNEDERFGRHAEPLKDWDEVEVHSAEPLGEQLTLPTLPTSTTSLNLGSLNAPLSSTLQSPSKGIQSFHQNRFFIAAIMLIIALVVMLFVLV